MARYLVSWEIDIEDATSHEDAARQAFAILQRPSTSATVFDVIEHDANGEAVTIDLDYIDDFPEYVPGPDAYARALDS